MTADPFDLMFPSDEDLDGAYASGIVPPHLRWNRDDSRERPGANGADPRPPPDDWQPIVIDVGLDLDPIPPRAWLLGTAFCREFVSSIFAAGSTGKTALRIAQLLSLASGKPLTGEHIFLRCRVMLIGLEDGIDELRRRVRAAIHHYGLKQEDLIGWFFIVQLPPRNAKLITENGGNTRLRGWIEQQISEKQLDLVCLDPLIKLHGLPENDNNAMERVIEILVEFAITHKIAVDVPHHTRKGANEPGDADAGRGAGAVKDGGRLVYTLTTMSATEAALFEIEAKQQRRYVRLDYGKVNLVPAGEARWFELISVKLGNTSETYKNGDEIQVARPWNPPETWAGLSDDILNTILDDIAKGLPDGRLYSAAAAAKDTAAWQVVKRHAPDKSQPQCREVITTWHKNGVVFDKEYTNPTTREKAKGLRVNNEKRPGPR
jgi:hypothetical protein